MAECPLSLLCCSPTGTADHSLLVPGRPTTELLAKPMLSLRRSFIFLACFSCCPVHSQWSDYPLHQETTFSLAVSWLSQEALTVFGCFTAVGDPEFELCNPEGESTSLRLLTVGCHQQWSWECQGQQNSHHWSQLGQKASSSQDLTFLEETLPSWLLWSQSNSCSWL
jgi:hypothetical protein